MPEHNVTKNDTLLAIARQHGYRDVQKILNHPENAFLTKEGREPNILYPGEKVHVPEIERKDVSGATEQKHTFKTRTLKQYLRIAVEGSDGQRMASCDYELTVEDQVQTGTTDEEGMFEVEIPPDAKTGRLKVEGEIWELAIGALNPLDESTPDGGVSGAQGRLLNLGLPVGPIDGILGRKTEAALRAFQADRVIEVTGKLDDETRDMLAQIHGS